MKITASDSRSITPSLLFKKLCRQSSIASLSMAISNNVHLILPKGCHLQFYGWFFHWICGCGPASHGISWAHNVASCMSLYCRHSSGIVDHSCDCLSCSFLHWQCQSRTLKAPGATYCQIKVGTLTGPHCYIAKIQLIWYAEILRDPSVILRRWGWWQ